MTDLSLNLAEQTLYAIYAVKDDIEQQFIRLAELLYECQSKGYYTSAGFDRFKDFASSIGLEWTKATRLVKIGEYVLTQRISKDAVKQIGYEKMTYLLPKFKDGTITEENIEFCKVAPQSDVRREFGYKMPDDESNQFLNCTHCGAEIEFHKSMLRRR